MATLEPVFGHVKRGRCFRQFLFRGLAQVQGEWLFICTGHNPLKPSNAMLPCPIRTTGQGCTVQQGHSRWLPLTWGGCLRGPRLWRGWDQFTLPGLTGRQRRLPNPQTRSLVDCYLILDIGMILEQPVSQR